MTSQLPPRVEPRTPREPRPERPDKPGRPDEPGRPDKPERRPAPPREFMQSRRDFTRAFAGLRRGWGDGTVGDAEVEAFQKLSALASELGSGTVTGEEVLDKLV